MRRDAGVTLVELLIAVTLVGLVSLGLLMAMRVGVSAMEKTNAKFLANRTTMSVERILNSQVAGLIPVVTECRPQGAAVGGRFVMFEGHADEMRFVSSYSLDEASRGYPRLLEFKVMQGDAGRGVRLVVNERVYAGPLMIGTLCSGLAPPVEGAQPLPVFPRIETGPASFVLVDQLAFCRFVYRRTLPPPELEMWVAAWPLPDLLPSGVRIEMAPLVPDPSRVQVVTVNAPVRINKWVLGPYAD